VVSDDPDVEEFIRVYIPSIWALELLIVLQRDPGRTWTAPALVKELRASAGLVDDNLSRFERHGLVLKSEAGWRFQPANPRLALLVAGLSNLYRGRPTHVMSLIARSDALRSFADAFRIKKDET
jgi:DNA-binding IclR family transcriptional regulator